MIRRIEVVPHDPSWRRRFEEGAARIRSILRGEVVAIHHIGSTAILSIPAKPIVDFLVEVKEIGRIDSFNHEMVEGGYRPKGEHGIPGRRFFVRGPDHDRTEHLHLFTTGHPEVERHLLFRDYLNAHPADARAYGELKRELANRFPHDMDGYLAGKEPFISETHRKAVIWREVEERDDA
jgi:GrpB-like predicted nucleotidyltransferase (UPF0157 family)